MKHSKSLSIDENDSKWLKSHKISITKYVRKKIKKDREREIINQSIADRQELILQKREKLEEKRAKRWNTTKQEAKEEAAIEAEIQRLIVENPNEILFH